MLLEERHREMLREADQLHRWRLESVRQIREGDVKAADDELSELKTKLSDAMVQELAEKKRALEGRKYCVSVPFAARRARRSNRAEASAS